jgi:hypothetical protein
MLPETQKMFGEGTLSALESQHVKETPVPDRLRRLSDQEVVLIEQALDLLAEEASHDTSDPLALSVLDLLRQEFTHENAQRFMAARRKMVPA